MFYGLSSNNPDDGVKAGSKQEGSDIMEMVDDPFPFSAPLEFIFKVRLQKI